MKEVFPEGRRDQPGQNSAEKPRVNQFGNVVILRAEQDSKLCLNWLRDSMGDEEGQDGQGS